ncbi:hypothetical protein F2P79_017120 [Pimephales promelas]|nr:hypothetical protein F2P79_017120 [Pimephales promelas]
MNLKKHMLVLKLVKLVCFQFEKMCLQEKHGGFCWKDLLCSLSVVPMMSTVLSSSQYMLFLRDLSC